jgi:ABC-type multidrug transport system permease subunit
MISQVKSNTPEDNERPFVNGDRPALPIPERHGFVTGWLKFMVVASAIGFFLYLFMIHKLEQTLHTSLMVIIMLMVFLVPYGISAIMLLLWKKMGFTCILKLQ